MWWNDYSNDEIKQICLDIEEKQEKQKEPHGVIHYWSKLIDQSECLYLLNVGEDCYKIGKTWSIRERLKVFRGTNPFLVGGNQVIALFTKTHSTQQRSRNRAVQRLISPMSDLEKSAHRWCRERDKELDKSYKSELFKLTPEDLRDLFSFLKLGHEVQLVPREVTEFLVDHLVNFQSPREQWMDASSGRKRDYGPDGFNAYAGKAKTFCESRRKLLTIS